MIILVRKAKSEDLSRIQDLNYKLFLWDKVRDPDLNFEWPYQESGKNYFIKRINEDLGACFVAEFEGVVVGYIAGRVNKEIVSFDTILRGELENMYVEEGARSRGVGKTLVREFLKWAKTKGAKSMIVEAYFGNGNAIKFYEACGFNNFAVKLETKLESET